MLKLIDKYIIKQFLLFFVSSLVVFCTLYLSVDFMTNIAKYSATPTALMQYYLLLTPSIIYQMMPIAFIMGVIFTLSSLNKTNELVVLFSSGMSLARVSAPLLITVGLISFFSFFVADLVLPKLDQKKDQVYYHQIKKKPWLITTVRTDKIWFRSKNRLFNLQTFISSESNAQGLTLYYFDDDWNLLQVVKSKFVHMDKDFWSLKDGTITLFEEESPFPKVLPFLEKIIGVNEEFETLNTSFNSADMMTTSQLKDFIKKNKEAGLNTLEYEVGFHKKISYAFAGLVLCLMGIPFSIGNQRSGGVGKNIGICILTVFSYWIIYSSFLNFGKHGILPPVLAAWAPNLLFFLFSIHLLIKVKK